MLNDAAKKLVAREARAATRASREMVALGANTDELAVKAWQQAVVNNAEFAQWPSAKSYFDTVFYNEVERN